LYEADVMVQEDLSRRDSLLFPE